jgi:DNA polymerase-3 subunit delta'
MLFRDIIGQNEVKQQLVELVQHNRLSHALLFLGREGSGALPLALSFANYVINLPKAFSETLAPADLFGSAPETELQLPSNPDQADTLVEKNGATRTNAMVHPDIHYSYPVITKKPGTPPLSSDYIAEWREFLGLYPYGNIFDWLQFIGAENKQGNITAHECSDIIRKLNLKSFESGYKILIMWLPEYLGKEGNRLLKLIEEPPPDTLFILVAESESSILSTIISRCQLVKIPSIEYEDVEQALIKRAGVEKEQAKLLASACEGNYREALHLLQHADEDFHHLLKEWLNATIKNLPVAQLKIIEEIAKFGREKQKQFLKHFIHLIESAVRLEIADEAVFQKITSGMSEKEKDFSLRLNKVMGLHQKEALASELDKACYYIERNANSKILFHALTIKIYHIIRNNIVVSV